MTGARAERPKVLLLGPSLAAVSGIATHLVEILRSPLAQDFELRHFQTGSQGRKETLPGKLARLLGSPLALAAVLVFHRVVLVHVNTSMDGKAFWRDSVYVIVSRALRRRVVYQVHGGALPDDFVGGRRLFGAFFRWLLERPQVVVLLTECERRAYAGIGHVESLAVIPNGIDVDRYAPETEKSFERRPLHLLYLGALHRAKGLFELVEAMRILKDRGQVEGLQLDIVGSGPAEASLKERVRDLGLARWVRLGEPVSGEDKVRLWRQADLFVLPSYREALPYVVLESLASGTPMVATAVGGVAEAVVDGEHVVFVPPQDAGGLADAIASLRSDPDRMRRMSRRCLERAREQYTIDRLAAQMRTMYRSVLRRGEDERMPDTRGVLRGGME